MCGISSEAEQWQCYDSWCNIALCWSNCITPRKQFYFFNVSFPGFGKTKFQNYRRCDFSSLRIVVILQSLRTCLPLLPAEAHLLSRMNFTASQKGLSLNSPEVDETGSWSSSVHLFLTVFVSTTSVTKWPTIV